MGRRAGSADLPLHGGHVPKWLGDRMTRLGTVITEAIVVEYGRDEMLRRLAHPFCGAVMGMDWHSSGITTSVIGALKRGLTPLSAELGIHVCGGRGNHSRRTPQELVSIRARTGEGRARAKARGVKMGRPFKMTPHQIKEALHRRDNGEPMRDIARSYNVSHSTISRLVTTLG
jgi:hypothetical protein